MAYDDKHAEDKALDALTKAVSAGSDKALFARGQIYFRRRAYPEAQRDLEQFLQTARDDFFKQQASRMLMEMKR
jgi:tetratricopeptide (TPR) repeat protein